jgi:hypothetical protein
MSRRALYNPGQGGGWSSAGKSRGVENACGLWRKGLDRASLGRTQRRLQAVR